LRSFLVKQLQGPFLVYLQQYSLKKKKKKKKNKKKKKKKKKRTFSCKDYGKNIEDERDRNNFDKLWFKCLIELNKITFNQL